MCSVTSVSVLSDQIGEVDELREGCTRGVEVDSGEIFDTVDDFGDGRIFVSAVAGEQHTRAPPAFGGFVFRFGHAADSRGREFEASGNAVLSIVSMRRSRITVITAWIASTPM